MTILSGDFESRSAIDIKKAGHWRYIADDTTWPLCFAYCADGQYKIWIDEDLQARMDAALPGWRNGVEAPIVNNNELEDDMLSADEFHAYNAGFEHAMWNLKMVAMHKMFTIPIETMRCTAAQCDMASLPPLLEKIPHALGLEVEKDDAGKKIMLKLCKPRAPRKAEKERMLESGYTQINTKEWQTPSGESVFHWWEPEDVPEEYVQLFNYCIQDVRTEKSIADVVPKMPQAELDIWFLDQHINERGVCVDIPHVHKVIKAVQHKEKELLKELSDLTQGLVSSPRQVDKMRQWLHGKGVQLSNLRKDTVVEVLRETSDMNPQARRALEIRQSLSKSSVAKYKRMLSAVDEDNRIRGMFRYHAAGTGRWGGKIVQLHNMPRGFFHDYEAALYFIDTEDYDILEFLYGDTMSIASTLIRPMICSAPGKEFICSDYASVEGRYLAWDAGEQHVLDHYNHERDMYIVAATSVFGKDYDEIHAVVKSGDKYMRTVGKPTELGLGYGGGIGAFASMAVVYGIDLETLPDVVFPLATKAEKDKASGTAASYLKNNKKNSKESEEDYVPPMSKEAAMACDIIKQKWRADRPATTGLWASHEEAAVNAVRNPGKVYTSGHEKFCVRGGFLKILLPSGRLLYYYKPKITKKKTPWGARKDVVTYMEWNSMINKWIRTHTYGGKLVENTTQAGCRDLLAGALLKLEKAGYPIVIHVHDEAAAEVPVMQGDIEEFESIMSELPPWAKGLPLKASGGWRGTYFRKD